MDIRTDIEKWFSNIVGKPYNIIKTFTFDENIFNCVSYTLNISTDWMWTNDPTWPKEIPKNLGIVSFKMLYEKYGYNICESDSYERGYDKIAFYAKGDVPLHAAKQYEHIWRSKINTTIVEHELDWLCGNGEYEYGDIVFIMKRKI